MTHPRWQSSYIGVASRTSKTSFAHHLLRTMTVNGEKTIESLCSPGMIQIYQGNKQRHLRAIVEASSGSLDFSDILFFDDARDGKYGNCKPAAELGVHAAYCPNGLTTEVWLNAILSYTRCRVEGRNRVGMVVDPPRSKSNTKKIANYIEDSRVETTRMKVFSMNMPFAALVAHGVKTTESRNGTMFTSAAKPGDKILLHVGQRLYPDGGEHRLILKDSGMTAPRIDQVTSLPDGFKKGQIVAILELGNTELVEDSEARSTKEIEQAVVARGNAMGRYLTKIRRVQWLRQGFTAKGSPGIFTLNIPTDIIPEFPSTNDRDRTGKDDLVEPGYSWEGGGGGDVCASRLNDDPFDTDSEEVDQWELFKKRVEENIKADTTMDSANLDTGRWP